MNKKLYLFTLPFVFLLCSANDSCVPQPSATSKERQVVERQNQIYADAQPAPIFDWSLERHLLTELYKARNNAVSTYTYIRNQYTGKILSSCPSIGFPISAATQLTNPQMIALREYQTGVVTLPQAEPNGLYAPADSRGTYVMCLNSDGQVTPRYYEEDVEAYVTPMQEINGVLTEVPGAKPSITINPKR